VELGYPRCERTPWASTVRTCQQLQWEFLEQAWIAHHRGGVMPTLLPDR